jgi:hypothetical protein
MLVLYGSAGAKWSAKIADRRISKRMVAQAIVTGSS